MDPQAATPRILDVPEQARFEIRLGDELAGFAEYEREARRIAFTHTEVEARFEGRGLGSQLIAAALDSARQEGVAVRPFCPFVREYIASHPAYQDLVPEQERERFGLAPDAASRPPPRPGA
ncbi:MAG TPA: GNAT family N-acetyltransferase [Conexibacter sp.]